MFSVLDSPCGIPSMFFANDWPLWTAGHLFIKTLHNLDITSRSSVPQPEPTLSSDWIKCALSNGFNARKGPCSSDKTEGAQIIVLMGMAAKLLEAQGNTPLCEAIRRWTMPMLGGPQSSSIHVDTSQIGWGCFHHLHTSGCSCRIRGL